MGRGSGGFQSTFAGRVSAMLSVVRGLRGAFSWTTQKSHQSGRVGKIELKTTGEGLPCGPVVKAVCFHCRGQDPTCCMAISTNK